MFFNVFVDFQRYPNSVNSLGMYVDGDLPRYVGDKLWAGNTKQHLLGCGWLEVLVAGTADVVDVVYVNTVT
jgi:hypothetical protein